MGTRPAEGVQGISCFFGVLAGTDRHREALRRVRDHALGKEGIALHYLADLYHEASRGGGEVGTEVLGEWLLAGGRRQLETAAALLERAPSGFVVDHLELVGRALERAEAFGEDCYRDVAFEFHRVAMSGMRTGTAGEPYPRDIELRNRCQAVLPTLPPGSPVERLVRGVLSGAERNIREAVRDDENE